ncbi:unnamed protein product [Sphagnum balticum]
MPQSVTTNVALQMQETSSQTAAAAALSKLFASLVATAGLSQLYLAFLNNWLISLAKQGQHHIALIVADECTTLDLVKPETRLHELPPPGKKGRTHLCSCMPFLRPTEGARLLLHLWIEELQGQPWTFHVRENDQPGFTRALNKTASQVDVHLLQQVAFSPGELYFTIDS